MCDRRDCQPLDLSRFGIISIGSSFETAGCNNAQLKCWWTFDILAVKEELSSGIVAICLPFKAAPLAAGRFLNKMRQLDGAFEYD